MNEGLRCPECDSTNTIKNGEREDYVTGEILWDEWVCDDCGAGFTDEHDTDDDCDEAACPFCGKAMFYCGYSDYTRSYVDYCETCDLNVTSDTVQQRSAIILSQDEASR